MSSVLLPPEEIHVALTVLNTHVAIPWHVVADKLHKEFTFKDFIQAFGFMSRVAMIAQALGHHPDWSNSYRRVIIDLTTHDAGGITDRDFELARHIEQVL